MRVQADRCLAGTYNIAEKFVGYTTAATSPDSAIHHVEPTAPPLRGYLQDKWMSRISHDEDKKNPNAWLSLLETGLPPHLQKQPHPKANVEGIEEIAEILISAQRFDHSDTSYDLLYLLGIEQGRWSAVVWLVKSLVEAFGAQALKSTLSRQTVGFWHSPQSLDSLTNGEHSSNGLFAPGSEILRRSSGNATLDQLLDNDPDNLSQQEKFAHEALGQVWRSLGHMTVVCADSEMRSEILELIAFLHHMGIMPTSIYNQKPSKDSTAIQQPVTLSLLSSRILISLSDAAWRAHERSSIVGSSTESDQDAPMRPNVPGSRHRVSVAGVRPEAWLELILWSCLHGGWVVQGCGILQTLYRLHGRKLWNPVSWRSLIPRGDDSTLNWDQLEYAFNTRRQSAMDAPDEGANISVHRTISSEVVNAYVDALASSSSVGVGDRDISLALVLDYMEMLRKLLRRGNLSLGAGSWDAIVLRLFDNHESLTDRPTAFKKLVELSPDIGAELGTSSGRHVPDYIFDGSAAVVGLHHRAIKSRIKAANIKGAYVMFKSLQDRADKNKRRSLVDFLEQQRSVQSQSATESGMFTSNFSGISYPALEMQIPPTVLGPLLELAVDGRAANFAKWMLYNDDIDGPIIPERMYTDVSVAPAVVRYATEMNDTGLLSKVIKALKSLSSHDGSIKWQAQLQSFFRAQVDRKNWDGAIQLFKYIKEGSDFEILTIADVARAMLFAYGRQRNGDGAATIDHSLARRLMDQMLKETLRTGRPHDESDQIISLTVILSHLDAYWANNVPSKRTVFGLSAPSLNRLMEGIVSAYGSVKARSVLETFWPVAVARAQRFGERSSGPDAGESRMPRFEPKSQETDENKIRSVIPLATEPPGSFMIYGGVRPNVATIVIIFYGAIEEYKATEKQGVKARPIQTTSQQMEYTVGDGNQALTAMAIWAINNLRWMRMTDDDITEELDGAISRLDVPWLRQQLPELLVQAWNDDVQAK